MLKILTFLFVIITIVFTYYNRRLNNRKILLLGIGVILFLTLIFNGTFIFNWITNYEFKVEKIKDGIEVLNLDCSVSVYNLYIIILWFISITITIIKVVANIIKKEKDYSKIKRGVIAIILISCIQTCFAEIQKSTMRNNILITYTKEMITNEVTKAKCLIILGICSNIIATNLFVLMNFKNKKENVSYVKGENS